MDEYLFSSLCFFVEVPMISLHTCAGYKYYGGKLPLTKDSPWYQFRDNLTYLVLAFSDWTHDQPMLQFVLGSHVPIVELSFLLPQLEQFVKDNQTPYIHLVFTQNDNRHHGELQFWIGLEELVADFDGHGLERVTDYIHRKQQVYAGELARREAQILAEEKRLHDQNQARQERRLLQEAKRLLGLS